MDSKQHQWRIELIGARDDFAWSGRRATFDDACRAALEYYHLHVDASFVQRGYRGRVEP